MGRATATKRQKPSRASSRAAKTAPLWPDAMLQGITTGKTRLSLKKGDLLYSQGQAADAVFFIESGKVRLSVLSKGGREAILGILSPGEFCGEGCLTGQMLRLGTATVAYS